MRAAAVIAAWERVAAECPVKRSADAHRTGDHHVHVIPLGFTTDVRCVPGEPVAIYPGYFRPRGGYPRLHPTGTKLPTREETSRGARAPDALPSRKTFAYLEAEMAGREEEPT